jgi:hypothetical protein
MIAQKIAGKIMDCFEMASVMLDNRLRDVLVAGFVDNDNGYLEFHPLYDRIYFIFENKKIEMSLAANATIAFKPVESIELWFEIDKEEGKFCVMSIFSILFGTEGDITIASFACSHTADGWATPECRIQFAVGKNEKELVFNPMNVFGFSFGVKSVKPRKESLYEK